MREIVLDTETTGLNVAEGHRIVSIGCVVLQDGIMRAEKEWFVNPERDIPEESFRIHGLTESFLQKQPCFCEIGEDFLSFIGVSKIIIHNAAFDLSFLNMELSSCSLTQLDTTRVIDTLVLAQEMFPYESVRLDALCDRYGIDRSERLAGHGALLDARLLAQVYHAMMAGHQQGLSFDVHRSARSASAHEADRHKASGRSEQVLRLFEPTEQEKRAHHAMIKDLAKAVWESVE